MLVQVIHSISVDLLYLNRTLAVNKSEHVFNASICIPLAYATLILRVETH